MISYHRLKGHGKAFLFRKDFIAVDTKADISRIANCILNYNWSPIIWKDGLAKQENFLRCQYAVLDFDDGETTLEDAKRRFCDMIHVIGTTFSHRREKHGLTCDRFRILFKFEKPIIDLRTYRYNMHKLIKHHGSDYKCKDGARFYYACKEIVSMSNEGYVQEVLDEVPSNFERAVEEKYLRYKYCHKIPPQLLDKFNRYYGPRNRNQACYSFAKDMGKIGFNFDEILSIIKGSESYRKVLPALSDLELNRTLKSALSGIAETIPLNTKVTVL